MTPEQQRALALARARRRKAEASGIPAPSVATGTPDFMNGGMDLVSEGGASTYKSKEERLRDNAAERRLAMAQKRVDQGPKQVGMAEAAGIGTLNAATGGNYSGIMSSHLQAAAERGRSPMYGNPLLEYAQDKIGDLLNPGNESQQQRETAEKDWQVRQGAAAMENPLTYMGGEIAGYLAPGAAAWKGGSAAVRALPFADDVARVVGKTRAGSYAGRLAGSAAAMTGDAALFGTTVGASDEQAIAAAQGQPIEMTAADRLKVGKQYATASVPVKTPLGEVPLPINALLPAAGSAVLRGGNVLRKGYATPDEIAARVYNNQGRVPFRGRAASSIAATGQTLNGSVTPNNIRGFRGIENALTDALEGVEVNGRAITKREIRDRIATGFDNIRQSVPSLDEPGIDLARLIEREFANDAPQIQETIRRFLLKVGLDSPAGRTLVQGATNQIRGQQAETLTNEVNQQLGNQPKQEVKDVLKGNKKLIQKEGYAKALGAVDIESPGQQEALDILSGGPEYKALLGEAARNAGVSVDDFVLRNPLEALHEVRSKLLTRAREMRNAGNPNYDLEDLTSQMADILDANVPGYNQLRNMYRSEAQAFERLGTTRGPEGGTGGEGRYDPGFGEKMLSPTNTPREEGRQTFKQIFDAMDPKSKRAAAISVRDVILADLDKVNAAGLEERYAAAAKLQKIKTEGGLAMMEEVFGDEGRAIAKRVRQFVDANQYSRDIDPAFNSLTTNKMAAMETGDIPFSSSLGRAMNKAGTSMSDSAAADLALMAFGGPPIATLMRGSPKLAAMMKPRGRTQTAIAETLLRQPGQTPRPRTGPPPAPITPLTQNDLPRGPNALASNESGFVRPDAASTMMTGAGATAGALNPLDLNNDGKKDWQDRAMTAALYGGAAYGAKRGLSAIENSAARSKQWLQNPDFNAAFDDFTRSFKPKKITREATEAELDAATARADEIMRQWYAENPTVPARLSERGNDMTTLGGFQAGAHVGASPGPDEIPVRWREEIARRILKSQGLDPEPMLVQRYDVNNRRTYARIERDKKRLGAARAKLSVAERARSDPDFVPGDTKPPTLQGTATLGNDMANALVGGTVGGIGGSLSGNFNDYNGDGVIDETDRQIGFMIGTGVGAVGAPAGTRIGVKGHRFDMKGNKPANALKPPTSSKGISGGPRNPIRAELPGSPEYERAVAKGLDMSTPARMQRARDMGFDTETVLYHGTATPFSEGKGIIWGSTNPDLANDYAAMRGHMNARDRAAGKSVTENQGLVKALVARREKTFDADLMPKTVTAPEFLTTVLEQSGKNFSEAETARLRGLFDTVRKARLREESGPHYGRHDFWYEPETLFGKDGAKAITEIFDMAGFDSIKMIEDGQVTYGIRNPANIRSVNAAFDPDMAASPMLSAGPSGMKPPRMPKLMKDVPVGRPKPGQRPEISGTIKRGQEGGSNLPAARTTGDPKTIEKAAIGDAQNMLRSGTDPAKVWEKTGYVMIPIKNRPIIYAPGAESYQNVVDTFFMYRSKPDLAPPDWYVRVLQAAGEEPPPLQLGSQRAPVVKEGNPMNTALGAKQRKR